MGQAGWDKIPTLTIFFLEAPLKALKDIYVLWCAAVTRSRLSIEGAPRPLRHSTGIQMVAKYSRERRERIRNPWPQVRNAHPSIHPFLNETKGYEMHLQLGRYHINRVIQGLKTTQISGSFKFKANSPCWCWCGEIGWSNTEYKKAVAALPSFRATSL